MLGFTRIPPKQKRWALFLKSRNKPFDNWTWWKHMVSIISRCFMGWFIVALLMVHWWFLHHRGHGHTASWSRGFGASTFENYNFHYGLKANCIVVREVQTWEPHVGWWKRVKAAAKMTKNCGRFEPENFTQFEGREPRRATKNGERFENGRRFMGLTSPFMWRLYDYCVFLFLTIISFPSFVVSNTGDDWHISHGREIGNLKQRTIVKSLWTWGGFTMYIW